MMSDKMFGGNCAIMSSNVKQTVIKKTVKQPMNTDVQIIKGSGVETGGNIFVEKTLSWEIESKEAREWGNYFGIKL